MIHLLINYIFDKVMKISSTEILELLVLSYYALYLHNNISWHMTLHSVKHTDYFLELRRLSWVERKEFIKMFLYLTLLITKTVFCTWNGFLAVQLNACTCNLRRYIGIFRICNSRITILLTISIYKRCNCLFSPWFATI
jgi:hypothetical protein